MDTTDTRLLALIDDLRAFPAETAWMEFKENNTDCGLTPGKQASRAVLGMSLDPEPERTGPAGSVRVTQRRPQ